jgi:hypothetical protein
MAAGGARRWWREQRGGGSGSGGGTVAAAAAAAWLQRRQLGCGGGSLAAAAAWQYERVFVRSEKYFFYNLQTIGFRKSTVCPVCVFLPPKRSMCCFYFNSLTAKSVSAGTKLVLFGRYVLNIYVGIVQYFLRKMKTRHAKIYLPTQRTNRRKSYDIN